MRKKSCSGVYCGRAASRADGLRRWRALKASKLTWAPPLSAMFSPRPFLPFSCVSSSMLELVNVLSASLSHSHCPLPAPLT